jgi:hypothetical protein
MALKGLPDEEREEMTHDVFVAAGVFIGTAIGLLLLPLLLLGIAL